MVRRFHRSIYDELDELRASMDYLYQLALEPTDNPLLPGEGEPAVICQYLHNLNAEVTGNDDEVMVTVDTVPLTGNAKISVELINRQTLKISCENEDDQTDDNEGNTGHEKKIFSLHHMIPLPVLVTPQGAKMSLRNGVLDIHLKKAHPV